MTFITGTATSFSDLRSALINGCTANGWSNSGNVLWKGNCYVELTVQSNHILIYGGTGQSGGSITGKSPRGGRLGGSFITFPVNYDLHIFENPDEVYFVVNYNVDGYQQMSFGVSSIAGMNNSPWFTAPHGTGQNISSQDVISLSTAMHRVYSTIFETNRTNSVGLFIYAAQPAYEGGSFIYSSIRGTPGWRGYTLGDTGTRLTNSGSASLVAGLLNCTPSAYNSGTILLPIKAVQDMGDNGRAVVVSLNNARFCRLDYHLPGEIISFGQERWKLYPWLRRNPSARNGEGSAVNHSGTFGYAIRYTGP